MKNIITSCIYCSLILILVPPSMAETFTWTGGGDATSWSDADNWDKSSIPNANGDEVVFNDTGTYSSNSTITLSEGITLGVFNFTDLARTLTLDGGGTYGFTMNSNSSQNQIFTASSGDDKLGTLILDATVNLNDIDQEAFDISIGKSSLVFAQSLNVQDATKNLSNSFNSNPIDGGGIFISNSFNPASAIDLNNGTIFVSSNTDLGTQAINFAGSTASGFRSIIATEDATLNNDLVNNINNNSVTLEIGVADGATFNLGMNSISDPASVDTSLILSVVSNDMNATGTIQLTGDSLLSTGGIGYEVEEGVTLEFAPANSGDTQTINGGIKNNGDILKTGEGTTTLADMKSKGQTTVEEGTLNITGGSGDYQPTGITVSGGTLNMETSPNLDTLDNVTVTVSGGTLNFNAEIATINALDLSSGEVGVNAKIDLIETLNLSGGTISFKDNHEIEAISAFQVTDTDVTIDSNFNSIDTILTSGSANVDVSETTLINGVVVGGGTVTFNADITLIGGFNGAIFADTGSLLVNATLTAKSAVEFSESGQLGGNGTLVIDAGQTFEMGGIFAPGDDGEIGTLTVDFEDTTALLDLSNVDGLEFELGANLDSDLLIVVDAVIDLGDSFRFDLFSFNTTDDFAAGSEYVLITTTDGFVGDFTTDIGLVNGYISTLSLDGNQLRLEVSNIPEPTGGALLLGGLGAWLLRRRTTKSPKSL